MSEVSAAPYMSDAAVAHIEDNDGALAASIVNVNGA